MNGGHFIRIFYVKDKEIIVKMVSVLDFLDYIFLHETKHSECDANISSSMVSTLLAAYIDQNKGQEFDQYTKSVISCRESGTNKELANYLLEVKNRFDLKISTAGTAADFGRFKIKFQKFLDDYSMRLDAMLVHDDKMNHSSSMITPSSSFSQAEQGANEAKMREILHNISSLMSYLAHSAKFDEAVDENKAAENMGSVKIARQIQLKEKIRLFEMTFESILNYEKWNVRKSTESSRKQNDELIAQLLQAKELFTFYRQQNALLLRFFHAQLNGILKERLKALTENNLPKGEETIIAPNSPTAQQFDRLERMLRIVKNSNNILFDALNERESNEEVESRLNGKHLSVEIDRMLALIANNQIDLFDTQNLADILLGFGETVEAVQAAAEENRNYTENSKLSADNEGAEKSKLIDAQKQYLQVLEPFSKLIQNEFYELCLEFLDHSVEILRLDDDD